MVEKFNPVKVTIISIYRIFMGFFSYMEHSFFVLNVFLFVFLFYKMRLYRWLLQQIVTSHHRVNLTDATSIK